MLITLTDYTDLAGSQTDESDCREANAYSVSQIIIAGPRQTVHGAGRTGYSVYEHASYTVFIV